MLEKTQFILKLFLSRKDKKRKIKKRDKALLADFHFYLIIIFCGAFGYFTYTITNENNNAEFKLLLLYLISTFVMYIRIRNYFRAIKEQKGE